MLLAAIGAGAIGGALALARLRAKLGADMLVAAATLGTAAALCLFGVARETWSALAASLLAGACWIAAVSNLNVSAQFALPEWVRGRGLAVYATVFFGDDPRQRALGRARQPDQPLDGSFHRRCLRRGRDSAYTTLELQTAAAADLSPSMHWPAPVLSEEIAHDEGPVLVTVEYRVVVQHRAAFLATLEHLSAERRRDGAYAWGLFEDTGQPGRYLETFLVESWLEHLRQHERVTNADRVLEERLRGLLCEPPKVTHLITAS